MPLGLVMARVDEVPRGERVYVICATGNRSARAVEWYRSRIDARNLAGETKARVESGKPGVSGPLPE